MQEAFERTRAIDRVVAFARHVFLGGIGEIQFDVAVSEARAKKAKQHGINSETGGACAAEWEARRSENLTFGDTLDLLKSFHRKAPFLFFNGNTFATIGRQLAYALFSDLPVGRKREVGSAIAHFIAGVLDREAMVEIVESLCASAELKTGDRVQTLRGTTRGIILRLLPDGRVAWQPDDSASELIALPESLVAAKPIESSE